MKIRTITCFYDPSVTSADETLEKFTCLTNTAVNRYREIGIDVQSTRLATIPFPMLVKAHDPAGLLATILLIESKARRAGFSYLSFGPAIPGFDWAYLEIPKLIKSTHIAFFAGVIADQNNGVYLPGIHRCGEIIRQVAQISSDGFANLRFSALANVPAFGPFFPAAYHTGAAPAFSLALESADLAVDAFAGADSLEKARQSLIESLEQNAHRLNRIAETLSAQFSIEFKGMDFSLAPFPKDWCSLGNALEKLGVIQLGLLGSLAAAAFVADALDRGKWKKAGFNGLMLPVLEDSILSQRTIDGTLGIKDLLLYAAVCGTGLDTVPLPGNATAEQLSAILADVAALAMRLNKPLTARLMPVPGKQAGDLTSYTFEYFSNGRILPLPAEPLQGFLRSQESFSLFPRH